MFFDSTNTTDIIKIYSLERPYTNSDENYINDNSKFLPTILADLKQIVTFFTNPQILSFKPPILYTELVEIHHLTRELCESEGIISNESKWDNFIDQQIELLNTVDEKSAKLAYNQLSNAIDLIKNFAYKEDEAHNNSQTLFCRFDSHGGYKTNVRYNQTEIYDNNKPTQFSFGDSLLSGYILDGLHNSNIEYGIGSSFGACTLSYWDNYRQAVQAKAQGYILCENGSMTPLNQLPDHYKNYFDFSKPNLYTVSLSNDSIREMQHDQEIYIPPIEVTISSAACFQSGELFHPKISLAGYPSNYSMDIEDLSLIL